MKTRGFINYLKPWVLILLFFPASLRAQTRHVQSNNQFWLGYMTSAAITDKYSLWNDFHLVPEGFCVVRTGLTRHFPNASITGGYAFLWLPPGSGKTSLTRLEHRPWGQVQFNTRLSEKYALTQRIRYDARFREKVIDGEIVDGFGFNHRVRFLVSVKRMLLTDATRAAKPYISVSDEVLLNFGKEVSFNTFDQNRLSLALGLQTANTQYQLGFMNRFVQTGPDRYTLNHTLVLWITQKFDLRKVSGIKETARHHRRVQP
jgi:hypothetical protein